jgi:protein-S-isoprenylcysteine O-methyltransferase Ste14
MQIEEDSAQVRLPPPLVFLAAILLGVTLQKIHPLAFIPETLRWITGAPMIALGLGVVIYCNGLFSRSGTNIAPWKPSSHLIFSGPYRFSRNPIYASFVLVILGTGFLANNAWQLGMAALCAVILRRTAIAKEEKYLEEKFGGEYRAYKARVRRWI